MTDLVFLFCFVVALLLASGLCALTYTSVKAVPEPDTTEEDTWEMPPVDPEATEPIRRWWN